MKSETKVGQTNIDQKIELAKNSIKQAVVLNALNANTLEKDIDSIDPFETMAMDAGVPLFFLLRDDERKASYDWNASLGYLSSFITQFIILLAKPGVLDQLAEQYRPGAAENLNRIKDYLDELESNSFLSDWLDYISVSKFSPSNEELDRVLSYYQFQPTFDGKNSGRFFDYFLNIDRFQRMIELYPLVHKTVL